MLLISIRGCWSFTSPGAQAIRTAYMPVDPKVLSVMRRSAGMPAAAPALPRFKFIDVITFFKVVLAAIDAL